MIRLLLAASLLTWSALAQTQEAKPAQEAQPPAGAKPAESPAPAAEKSFSGSVEVGYRWRSQVGGNFNAYRSVVDLGEGPKLFGLDLSIEDPSRRLFDRLNLFGVGWGGDPHNTARLDVLRSGLYRLTFDYRNLAYFNFLPSFANPQIAQGVWLNQRSFDIHRRYSDLQLDLMPGRRVSPFLAYSRDSGFGRGITTFVADGNEYPLATGLRDKTDHYRGGLRVELNRFHATVEQGGTTFKDDQQVANAARNFGNRTTPFSGQALFLDGLQQAYGIRGDSIYTRALATASLVSWASLYGQFLYSRPRTDANYSLDAAGQFVLLGLSRFFTGQKDLLAANARMPHSSGQIGLEIRPWRKLRLVESWLTDRLENTSTALLAETLFFAAGASQALSSTIPDQLTYNYSRQQLDVIFDLTARLTLRGGHRDEWGDAKMRAGTLSQLTGLQAGELRRHVALAGFHVRPTRKLSVNADLEAGSGGRSYFRTSLYDHQRLRARARYQVLSSLLVGANFSLLNNQNPTPGVNYDFLSRASNLNIHWTPAGGKRVSLLGEYTRSTLRSDLLYRVPQILATARSLYRDNAHGAVAVMDIGLPAGQWEGPKISLGGSLLVSSGSRPTNYYQPLARVLLPVYKQVQWFGEWRWHGFTEPYYSFEGFRAHLFLTGLRLTMQ